MEAYCQQGVEASDGPNGYFDCNICLDNAHDPVVTLCGHLYCWPCMYQWLHFKCSFTTPEDQKQCPVCKTDISHTTLVPIYGRGHSSKKEFKVRNPFQDTHRDQAMVTTATSTPRPGHNIHLYQPHPSSFASSTSISPTALNPIIGLIAEIRYQRVFGNSPAASLYWNPNVYQIRSRREERQAEKTLNRISVFILCCFVLCFLLFHD